MYLAIFLALIAPAAAAQSVGDEPMEPATNPASWVTNQDYPVAAMRDEREGVSGFRLTIGPDGLPQRCEIIGSSGHPDLDAATCRLVMERARFKPGRNARGEAVGGTYSNRIRWQIPDGSDHTEEMAGFEVDTTLESWPRGPIPDDGLLRIDPAVHYPPTALAAREEGTVHMELAVDSAGRVSVCKVKESSLSAALDDAACALMRNEGKFSPALDSEGKPTTGVLAATFRWSLPHDVQDAEGTAASGQRPRPPRQFPLSEPGKSILSMRVNADGTVTDCTYLQDGETWLMAPGINPCDTIGGAQRYIPFTDAEGKPVAKDVTLRIELKLDAAGDANSAMHK
jgi:TonB family protein